MLTQACHATDAQGRHRRRAPARFRGSTRRDERQEPRPDLVQRDFTAPAPNRLWVADLTQRMTGEGFLYLSTVLDVFSRRASRLGHGRARHDGVGPRRPGHRGVEPPAGDRTHPPLGPWLSIRLGGLYQAAARGGHRGVDGRVGDAYDNAVAESQDGSCRQEWTNQVGARRCASCGRGGEVGCSKGLTVPEVTRYTCKCVWGGPFALRPKDIEKRRVCREDW